MAEESEKRFHAIMDKLFHAPPKSKSKLITKTATNSTSLSGVQLSRGRKRPNMGSALAVLEPKSRGDVVEKWQHSSSSGGPVQAPLCRPWDRGDLLKRLATFKSMTWFAKPKAVSAVNCARRGWVNLDMDIIACEACGARLLFSTPASWTQQQVEKAALVFSLKLDNGHKLLCPWVDNACDESLAQFPPAPSAVLVNNYNKRCSALLQLLALPVISSSAIDYMRSPQLEHFLQVSSTIECGNKSADASRTEFLGNECEAVSSVSYYQAQKLISLCGWDPRSLPYTVECKDRQDQSTENANHSDLSYAVSSGQNPSISVYSPGPNESMETNDDPISSGGVQSDPNSVVLDCGLCGASVGLWAFSMVSRPLEFFRLVGYSEVNGENDAAHHKENDVHCDAGVPETHDSGNKYLVESREGIVNTATIDATSSNERPLNLNLTIAGGPPPTKQNFRATISLPVIGRNLRARFSSDFDFRDHLYVKSSFQGGEEHTENSLTGQGFRPEDLGLLQGERHDGGHSNSTSNKQLTCLNINNSEQGDRSENNCHMSLEGPNISREEIPETSTPDSVMENTQSVLHGSLRETAENVGTVDPAIGDFGSAEVGDTSITNPDGHATIGNGKTSENDSSMMVSVDICHLEQNQGTDTICSKQGDGQDGSKVEARVQPVKNNILPCCIGKDLKQPPFDKAMEFDPIRQHRHFCPWIASSGSSTPGWQQTLSALHRRESSNPLATNAPSSSSLIEVDDPIASVKMLFMSPSAKRAKLARDSS